MVKFIHFLLFIFFVMWTNVLADKVNVGWVTEVQGNLVKVKVTKDYMKTSFKIDENTKVYYMGFKGVGIKPDGPKVGMGVKYRCNSEGGRASTLNIEPILKPAKPVADMFAHSFESLFQIGDENKDGFIDIVEFSTYFRGSGKRSPKHFPGVFCKNYDQDDDQRLSFKEFKATIMGMPKYKRNQKTPEDWMRIADTNRDGEISVDEFIKNIPAVGHKEKVVPRNDKDKSGGLSLEELTAYLIGKK